MLLTWVAGLQAQPSEADAKPSPADPGAPISAQPVPAALKDYKAFADPITPRDWRAANRRVQEAGGWRAYAKEAAADKAAPAASAASAASAVAPRQAHHHHHGGQP
ncbi:hypothetical protein [Paucibacter sp. Y2R2-4]|uniref:hypothetical protein n=1 Tax=Paucibacter sp. Y2R2-4 TaxID=2893553 RepID=UPI0021E4E5F2|nr:hypothetical protein [Paucibacter sp. Y2R2-4]MCV2350090.1 hypothetical protein [Paucibacter sp. Y2R2-4]